MHTPPPALLNIYHQYIFHLGEYMVKDKKKDKEVAIVRKKERKEKENKSTLPALPNK